VGSSCYRHGVTLVVAGSCTSRRPALHNSTSTTLAEDSRVDPDHFAPEGRKNVAQGVSPGTRGHTTQFPSPGGVEEPGAMAFCRPSGAPEGKPGVLLLPHGLRRGLPSHAPAGLTNRETWDHQLRSRQRHLPADSAARGGGEPQSVSVIETQNARTLLDKSM
jgi:hypothetical protein